ncbi:MAG: glycosyltransferase family 4 protein [Actinobacteria bacterium]|nr:glycosyltransferase family 4 protein [Actinomycetota bacterium]
MTTSTTASMTAGARRRVLVITGDPIAPAMAGPGIRACELARVLSATMDVRVASLASVEPVDFPFDVVAAHRTKLIPHVDWADVLVVQGFVMALNPWLGKTNKVIVADLYDPMHFEHLEDARSNDARTATREVDQTVAALTGQLRRADFFICASEKQRDMWLGHLAAVGRINPFTYAADDTLRNLIDVVPFGISDEKMSPTGHGIKGVVEGINADDKVVLWGGGIYNWFDPLTLIRAMAALAIKRGRDTTAGKREPNARLFFLGVAHPNPDVAALDMVTRARALSDELGLTGTHVFFNETWVPYAKRANYLADADLGVSTHLEHLETAFSFRTRILDYLWAGLPVVSTAGDAFADIIDSSGAGIVVPERDVVALSRALEKLLFTSAGAAAAQASQALSTSFLWSTVAKPLVEFCESATPSADKSVRGRAIPTRFVAPSWLAGKIRGARAAWKRGGLTAVTRRLSGK